MRRLQIMFLILGGIAFAGAGVFMGTDTAEILWEVAVGILLFDAVLILLWPSRKAQSGSSAHHGGA
ncbi:MAG: hypothetical protein ABIK65_02935 [Candidatus Eisenbacteria bacterium]